MNFRLGKYPYPSPVVSLRRTNMGNSESVDKQDTIEKIPKYASAAELGIFTENDRENMPRLSKQADVDQVICVNARRIEDSESFDLSRKKVGSEDLNCHNDKSRAHLASQATSPENTTSTQAVLDRLHHSIVEWYPEHTNEIARVLLEMETNSLNALMEQPRHLRDTVDEVVATRLVTRNSEESHNTPQGKGWQVDPAKMQELGEQLYEIISKWHPAKAEKLVGMFLELGYEDLKVLAGDTAILKEKVQEAAHILESSQADSSQNKASSDAVERELLGDQVYETVAKLYPDHADIVTGMLLEMDVQDLLVLVETEELLSEKVQQAYTVLSGVAEVNPKHQPSFDIQETGEELYKAAEKIHPECADKITGMLLEMDWKYLDDLIENPGLLEEKIEEAFIVLENTLDASKSTSLEENEIQTIGEQLYAAVENLQPNDTDKITGMLLEMPTEDLKALMENHKLLEEKIVESLKALTEDEASVHPDLDEKESLGEQLYNIITNDFPEQAEIITGMLLEMDPGCIVELLQNPKLLQEKVQVALNVLSESEKATR